MGRHVIEVKLNVSAQLVDSSNSDDGSLTENTLVADNIENSSGTILNGGLFSVSTKEDTDDDGIEIYHGTYISADSDVSGADGLADIAVDD